MLSLIETYFPGQIHVLPDPMGNGFDPLQGTCLDPEKIARRRGEIEEAFRKGLMVVEEAHFGVHAAYCAAMGDEVCLAEFYKLEEKICWPDVFVHLEIPLSVSTERCRGRGGPETDVEFLKRAEDWLSRWHVERDHELVVIAADRSPEGVLGDLVSVLGLRYRSLPPRDVFPYLLLLGRPAAGKSELIRFLKGLPAEERAHTYHLGSLLVLDDFPILWEKFVEDDIWEAVGKGRLISQRVGDNYYVADDRAWPFLIEMLNRRLAAEPELFGRTVIIEFSRGGERGYREALRRLHRRVLERGAILYLDVSVKESWQRNLSRCDRGRRGWILAHSVPWEEYERTYRTDDWHELAPGRAGYLVAAGVRVPYVTVRNDPEPVRPADFAARFAPALAELYKLWEEVHR
ncbi:MAG TPA: hypothetical protein ENF77_04840 [Candidatus Acetothermia bacterium]|nr:hypothetical protein [Candidatus Acetothermia bacterium]